MNAVQTLPVALVADRGLDLVGAPAADPAVLTASGEHALRGVDIGGQYTAIMVASPRVQASARQAPPTLCCSVSLCVCVGGGSAAGG